MKYIPEAGGLYKSRKFILTLMGLILITLLTILSGWLPVIPTVLPTFVGGMLGILSLYFAGNVGNKYIVGKTLVSEKEDETTKGDEI